MARPPKQRQFGEFDPLPNTNSKNNTVASRYIDFHYANLRLIERWTWDRYARFCTVTKLTPYEMASLVMMPHRDVARFRARNTIGGDNAQVVALLLTIIEAQLLVNLSLDVIKNPFPDLQKAEAAAP